MALTFKKPYVLKKPSEFQMSTKHLSSDLLRTFLAIVEEGSVTAAADRIHRSQSATSLQIKQLEDTLGQPVFRRLARGMELTEVGEQLLPVARQTTNTLDRTLDEIRGTGLVGQIKIGLPDDHSHTALADIVADFAERHPDVAIEVNCAFGSAFSSALDRGELDLAVYEVLECAKGEVVLRCDEMIWARSRSRKPVAHGELPVALFDRDCCCWWRDVAISSLDEAGTPYKVVFTSESAVGVNAAVRAGIAAALMRSSDVKGDLVPVKEVPAKIPSHLVFKTAPAAKGPVLNAMIDAMKRAFPVDA
jgi:DNA-binding transcriptional LysR family regulator